MLIDLIAIAILAFHAWLGWRRGLALSIISLSGIVAGYAVAYGLHRPLGGLIGQLFGLQPLLSYPLAGSLVFFTIWISSTVASMIVRKRQRRREEEQGQVRPTPDRALGAVAGLVQGSATVIFLAWAAAFVQGAVAGQGIERRPVSIASKLSAHVASHVAQAVVGGQDDNAITAMASALAKHPESAARNIHTVLGDPRVQLLLQKPQSLSSSARTSHSDVGTLSVVSSKTTDRLSDLVADPGFVQAAQNLGLIRPQDATSKKSATDLRNQLAQGLLPLAQTINTLKHDPEIRRILRQPGFLSKIKRGNLTHLANDPDFNQLAQKVVAQLRTTSKTTVATTDTATKDPLPTEGEPSTTTESPPPGSLLYRWTDERGVVHLSNQAPPEGTKYQLMQGR